MTSARAKDKRESLLKYFWVACVKDEFDVGLPFQFEAEFSYAVAVMDKVGGWDEGGSAPKPWSAIVKNTWKTS